MCVCVCVGINMGMCIGESTTRYVCGVAHHCVPMGMYTSESTTVCSWVCAWLSPPLCTHGYVYGESTTGYVHGYVHEAVHVSMHHMCMDALRPLFLFLRGDSSHAHTLPPLLTILYPNKARLTL